MRLTLTLAAIVVAAVSTTAHAGDLLPPPAYGAAPPPPPGYAYPPPQAYGYAPPPAYRAPPGVIAAPEGNAYVVPGPAYQGGSEYEEQPVAVDARRYYRECWWEWGYRRCALRAKTIFW